MCDICPWWDEEEICGRSKDHNYLAKKKKKSKDHGLEWGVLFGFEPGLTMETIVLRSISIDTPCVSAHDNAKSLCSCEKTYG